MLHKKIASILAIVLSLSLAACSGVGASQSGAGKEETTGTTEQASGQTTDDFWADEAASEDAAEEAAETASGEGSETGAEAASEEGAGKASVTVPETATDTSGEKSSDVSTADSTAESAATSLESMLGDAQEKTEAEVALAAFSPGVYKDDTYTQPYFGIRLKKEDNMTWSSTDDLLNVSGIEADWNDAEAIEAALADNYLMDFQAYTTEGDSIMVEIFKVTMSEEKMLSDLSGAMETTMKSSGAENIKSKEEEITFLGEKRKSILTTSTINGVNLYMRFCGFSKGPYTIVFYSSCLYEDNTQKMLDKFKAVE